MTLSKQTAKTVAKERYRNIKTEKICSIINEYDNSFGHQYQVKYEVTGNTFWYYLTDFNRLFKKI